jgi:hypothetical protein
MISNYINYTVNNKKIKIKELTFHDFRVLCKSLFSDDVEELSEVFENLIATNVKGESLNLLEKIYALIILRNLTHGNEFTFMYDGKKVKLDLNSILNNFKFNNFEIKQNNFIFTTPINLFNASIDQLVTDSLSKIFLTDKEIDCNNLTFTQKQEIIFNTSLPLINTFNLIKEQLEKSKINFYKEIDIDIFDSGLLIFLKRIFSENLDDIYTFEYACIKNLNMGAYEMQTYTYPELKIFLQNLTKEMKERQKESNSSKLNSEVTL